jgi:hypothetical protein
MHTKVDFRSFHKSICMPESKFIRCRGGAAAVLECECRQGECNSVSFLSIVPKQQNRMHVFIV